MCGVHGVTELPEVFFPYSLWVVSAEEGWSWQ